MLPLEKTTADQPNIKWISLRIRKDVVVIEVAVVVAVAATAEELVVGEDLITAKAAIAEEVAVGEDLMTIKAEVAFSCSQGDLQVPAIRTGRRRSMPWSRENGRRSSRGIKPLSSGDALAQIDGYHYGMHDTARDSPGAATISLEARRC